MRVAVLTTGTNNTPMLYRPLARLGHELTVIKYDALEPGCQALPMLTRDANPDWVLYIGALEASHGKPVPPVEVLREIGLRYPMVHLCCDGAEPAWWPQLVRYYDQGSFALQVNIDGVRTGPIGERGLTLLPPIDPADYSALPAVLSARSTLFGFAGYLGHGKRRALLASLLASGTLTVRPRDDDDDQGYRDFLADCACVWNHPLTSGGTRVHVKARCVEAGLAGALLLEAEGSPLRHWFTPGLDYVTYRDAVDAIDSACRASFDLQDAAQKIATSFRQKLLADHTPKVFWDRVLLKIGLVNLPLVYPEPQIPFTPWSLGKTNEAAPVGSAGLVSYDGTMFQTPQGDW